MSTSIRISTTLPGEPQGGFIGAITGGREPGPSIETEVSTDELEDVDDIANFIQFVTPHLVMAFRHVTAEEEPLIIDRPDDEAGVSDGAL